MKQSKKQSILLLVTLVLFFTGFVRLVSDAMYAYIGLEIGRFLGPIPSLILPNIFFAGLLMVPLIIFLQPYSQFSKKDMWLLAKRKKRKVITLIVIGYCISSIIAIASSIIIMPTMGQDSKKIDFFVANNKNETLQNYNANLILFLNSNLNCCYNKLESSYKVNGLMYMTLVDPWIANYYGITQADIILYQGWGACGEAAIVLQQIMHDSGYQTRLGTFKGIDHEWAEVKNETQWLIVDPWDIGNLVNTQTLRTEKTDFLHATGVEVQYYNSTNWVDASKEHGYD
jgi:hypothetical protein